MRASEVARGFKWLVDKLHPRLPLSTKESQRLLTALNTSFRRHLDEAHPTATDEHPKKPLTASGIGKINTSFARPSAHSYADRHLASVLTNPLFVPVSQDLKPPDYASARDELAKDPQKDPIQLLEEYHAKDAANVRIAELCLETMHRALNNISAESARVKILRHEPGRRVLLWLLNSRLYLSETFFENARFIDFLVRYLILEGREENLWDWIRLNLEPDDYQDDLRSTKHKQRFARNRWKGRVLRAMIMAKMGDPDENGKVTSANALGDALSLFQQACDIKRAASSDDHLQFLPLFSAASAIITQTTWKNTPRPELDATLFDKFLQSASSWKSEAPQIYGDIALARLELCHPLEASTKMARQVVHRVLSPAPDNATMLFLARIKDLKRTKELQNWYFFMMRTLHVLQENKEHSEVAWLTARIVEEYPALAQSVKHLQGNSMAKAAYPSSESVYRLPIPGLV